jgi:hypothetical protein
MSKAARVPYPFLSLRRVGFDLYAKPYVGTPASSRKISSKVRVIPQEG